MNTQHCPRHPSTDLLAKGAKGQSRPSTGPSSFWWRSMCPCPSVGRTCERMHAQWQKQRGLGWAGQSNLGQMLCTWAAGYIGMGHGVPTTNREEADRRSIPIFGTHMHLITISERVKEASDCTEQVQLTQRRHLPQVPPPPPPSRQCLFLTPICIVPPSDSLLKLCAFEWLQSSSPWWVDRVHTTNLPSVPPTLSLRSL